MKNRAVIYQREAAEMLQNIAQYPGLIEEQLCRFFPEKESTAKRLLSHMVNPKKYLLAMLFNAPITLNRKTAIDAQKVLQC